MAGRTGATLLAGVGHEHLVFTVRAAHPGKALMQVRVFCMLATMEIIKHK